MIAKGKLVAFDTPENLEKHLLSHNEVALTSEQDGKEQVWSYQGEELEIDSFQNALNALTAYEFTAETPSGKEEIGLTVSLDREDAGEVHIKLYRYDGEH